ncbi:MAG TPA: hypothetical protein PK843_19100 [bacterium]|nr:hypothetical protein [bacterium]
MNRNAKKMLISVFLGILFFFSLIVVTDIYSSDSGSDEKTLVFIQNDAKFGEERIIIITETEEAAREAAYVSTINPNPLPSPPDTLN